MLSTSQCPGFICKLTDVCAIMQMVCNAAQANRNEAFLVLADLMDTTAVSDYPNILCTL